MPNTAGHGGNVNQSHSSVLPHSRCRAPPPRQFANYKVRVHVTKLDYLRPLNLIAGPLVVEGENQHPQVHKSSLTSTCMPWTHTIHMYIKIK